MNKNLVIVLAGAVIIAVLVALLVQFSLRGKKAAPPPVAKAPQAEILIATKALPLGHTLAAGDARWQKWPADSIFPGAVKRTKNITAEKALEGRLARAVAQGEPLTKSALLSNTKGNVVAASLEPGQRAVSIAVSATTMVSGFITPGDYVDVVLTYKESMKNNDDPDAEAFAALNLKKLAVETILQNVKVLAVDQLTRSPKDNKVKVGRTVTLAVDLQRAEMLALAGQVGTLSLMLRGVGDDENVERAWPIISDARITNADDEIHKQYLEYRKENGTESRTIKIFNGETLESVSAQ